MNVQVLHVPGCPNVAVLIARLERSLTGRSDVRIERFIIRDEADAAARCMTGSPTVLVDGVDPFAPSNQLPSLSCRLYLDEDGVRSGSPSVAQLRAAMAGKARSGSSGQLERTHAKRNEPHYPADAPRFDDQPRAR